MENLYMKDSIRTFTGKYIDIFNPKPEDIDIRDIAHALSQVPRFSGHLPYFRSVAEHSLRVAELVPDEYKFEALLHDASETYMGDVASPHKYKMLEFKLAEERLMTCIANKFGFQYPMSRKVKTADKQDLHDSWDNIMLCDNKFLIWWNKITYSHSRVEGKFLRAFKHYRKLDRWISENSYITTIDMSKYKHTVPAPIPAIGASGEYNDGAMIFPHIDE